MTQLHTNLENVRIAGERVDTAQVQRIKFFPHALETSVGDGDEPECLDIKFPIKSLNPLEDGVTAATEIIDDHCFKIAFGVSLDQLSHAVAFRRPSDKAHRKSHPSGNPCCP